MMIISQKKFSNRTRFEFNENKLKYTIKDTNGGRTFSVNYEDIPIETEEFVEKKSGYRNVGILWAAIGLFQIFANYAKYGHIGGAFWFLIGILCFLLYFLSKTEFTVFSSNKGDIFIIKDKKHDSIIDKLLEKRKKQMLLYCGHIDFGNDPEHEINKFIWSRECEVISEEEFQQAVSQIREAHNIEDNDRKKLLMH